MTMTYQQWKAEWRDNHYCYWWHLGEYFVLQFKLEHWHELQQEKDEDRAEQLIIDYLVDLKIYPNVPKRK